MNTVNTMNNCDAWRAKAHEIIRIECERAYRAANPKPVAYGRRPKTYHPPTVVHTLVRLLNQHDTADAERKAKRIFIDYADSLPGDSPLFDLE